MSPSLCAVYSSFFSFPVYLSFDFYTWSVPRCYTFYSIFFKHRELLTVLLGKGFSSLEVYSLKK